MNESIEKTLEVLYMHTIYEVANWFLSNVENVTNKKLQKLVYYAYSWFLVFNNETADRIDVKFFDANFEAWVHGAVSPELYNRYKKLGSANIPKYNGKLADFSDDETDILEQVKSVYGGFNGNELEYICHQETPWKNARKHISTYEPSKELIKDKDIFEYYSSKLS